MDDHDHSDESADLTQLVGVARRGFRRDVQVLLDGLAEGELLVPLASSIPGAEEDGVELSVGLQLHPHLLIDPEEKLWCALFTRAAMLERVADALDWRTDGDDLEHVSVPAAMALEMALAVIDEDEVLGLVINPMDETELVLRRDELASLCAGQAVPLVGYVQHLPEQDFERTLVAEDGDPPPPELTAALDGCVERFPELTSWQLTRTFNPDRDREPHLTLRLFAHGADHRALAEQVFAAIEPHLPPPGYVDVVFDAPLN